MADDVGNTLAGVAVSVRNQDTGLRRSALTDPDGRYAITSLPVEGLDEVRAELTGFVTVVRERVPLTPNETLVIDFSMRVAVLETVTVTAATPLVDLGRSTVQQTVNEPLVRTLPLLGRNFIHLASLTAGFTGNPSFPSPQGQVFWANNVLVDGASHFSKWRSAARTFNAGYGLESIKEVQVLANRFSAEFGEALATVTSAVTKAGTNQFRGAGLLFVQDDALNAAPVFAIRKPPVSAQQFGSRWAVRWSRTGRIFSAATKGGDRGTTTSSSRRRRWASPSPTTKTSTSASSGSTTSLASDS